MMLVTGWTQWESLAANRRSLDWRGRGPDGEQLGRRPGNTRISSDDQRKYNSVDLSICSRRKEKSGWREWRHKKMRKENGKGECGKPICEHKRSTSVVTRFFQNRRKQILLLNLKKTFTFYLSYTLFRLTGKICCFFYPAVSVAAKEGALYGRWGG